MSFLTFSNADIQFFMKEFTQRSYTTAEALPTTKQEELIDKKEFGKAVLNKNSETFMIHVTILETLLSEITIHPLRKASIAALKQD